jgi:hypothetical protein
MFITASEDRPGADLFFQIASIGKYAEFCHRQPDSTRYSARGVIRALYDGAVLRQSRLGHRILARKTDVANKLLVSEL